MHRCWQLRGPFLSSLHKNHLFFQVIRLLTLLNLVSRGRASSERATRGTITLHSCGRRLLPSPKISAPGKYIWLLNIICRNRNLAQSFSQAEYVATIHCSSFRTSYIPSLTNYWFQQERRLLNESLLLGGIP